jgi:Tfp pilus assembly protein PilF
VFADLLSYAPGLNTTSADLLAVIEAESRPTAARRPGVIDPGARKLLDAARKNGWRITRIPGTDAAPGYAIFHDDADRWSWERTLPSGLHEHVICDGTTLWHLYPELGLAAKRQLGRAHRLEFAARVAGAVPRAEDLAVGAEVKLLDACTVAVVPHHADQSKPEAQARDAGSPSLALRASTRVAKAAPHVQVRFVFAKDGRLAERHWVEMPAKRLLRKEMCPEPEIADEPTLTAEVKNLVVVPMPFRTPEHVHAKLRTAGKALNDLTFAEATELLASWVAQGNGDQAKQIFQTALRRREQRLLGYYVLLAAAGVPLDSDAFDVAEEHPGDPLANYLAVHSSPVLRKHASRWAAAGNAWESGFLRRLGLGHALLQRWSGKTAGSDAERTKALAYVRDHAGTALAWALLGLVQDRIAEDRDHDTHDAWHDLARAYLLFSDTPAFADLSRYEMARCLWRAGARDKARTRFLSLFDDSVSSGRLLRIDADFRAALLGAEKDGWGDLMRRTAKRFIGRKERGAALLLARQCWQLDDQATAQALFRMTMQGVSPKGADGLRLYRAALDFLMQTGQLAAAQPLLDELLKDPEHAKRPALWRLAITIAEQREQHAAALAARKKALDLEYERQPEVINLEQVRREYSGLLDEYETLAKSLKKLNLAVPAGFRDEVVRTADRWRALDRDQESASRQCARVLRVLGERELAWDYLTTPVALRPGEADVWVDLAQTLAKQGERDLADRAYQSAFEREATNAQVLWDRAENLRQAGRQERARRLYRQLADGAWQPRFASLKEQARWAIEGR